MYILYVCTVLHIPALDVEAPELKLRLAVFLLLELLRCPVWCVCVCATRWRLYKTYIYIASICYSFVLLVPFRSIYLHFFNSRISFYPFLSYYYCTYSLNIFLISFLVLSFLLPYVLALCISSISYIFLLHSLPNTKHKKDEKTAKPTI